MGKPRMTRSDKWKKPPRIVVANYRAFSDEVRIRMGSIDLNHKAITFGIPMPPSWPEKKKKKMHGTPHTSKPDLDNLLKALIDALYSKRNTLHTHGDDMKVHSLGPPRKIWWDEGAIWID